MARILKGDARLSGAAAAAGVGRLVSGDVYDAAQRSRQVLDQAEADAAAIRAGAEAERQRWRAEAAEAGRQEGLAGATEVLARAALERDRLLASAGSDLVRLALAIAEKIVRIELARPEAVVEIAARALEEARQRRHVSLRVHPEDAAAIRSARRGLADLLERARGIAVREDPRLERGAVVVETEAGSIDARLGPQLEALRRALEEAGS